MRRIKLPVIAGLLLVFATLAAGVKLSLARSLEIKGYVLDAACAFTKDLEKPVSPSCAVSCAKAGSTLVVLGDDGAIYWPISKAMPAKGQNALLMPFAGKRVKVSGEIYEKGGSHAIVIKKIEETEKNR